MFGKVSFQQEDFQEVLLVIILRANNNSNLERNCPPIVYCNVIYILLNNNRGFPRPQVGKKICRTILFNQHIFEKLQ